MPRSADMHALKNDPRKLLGVGCGATEEDIRKAYLSKIKEYPPERSPVEFEKIRDAYDVLRTPRKRIYAMLDSVDPSASIESLFDGATIKRRFVGPAPWLAALKER